MSGFSLGHERESVLSQVKHADIDDRLTGGTTSGGQAGIRRLRQENDESNRANEILK